MDNKNKKGVIYILTNPSFPKFVKIGYAHDLKKRLNQFNHESTTPYGFRAHAIYEVDRKLTDKKLHKLIDSLNPNLRAKDRIGGKNRVKEFFEMSKEDAYLLLEGIATISGTENRLKYVTPEGCEISDKRIAEINKKNAKKKTHKPPFKFSECGIPIGAKIVFTRDSSIVATVVDDRHIEYNGQITAMTPLAKKMLNKKKAVQGTAYFMYKGKKLTDIRKELTAAEN